ncbi:MAG TPA: bifunctional 5,10-methylenetetrahydrofolate dehydrogenase/5,10-methenyltetrahydrofolate cyclohydrolase [Candidatus Marinimicrobia bacterium]|jgi:methylenetetrahydrofolate dehydrogenase (NADP+)/methenyltetrahydrofolate cyclohydrolase|nr:bifunctional 5,10-methylenetetrahydrofolate dehydrogenase/5,10-methenyltetrahydrofolate cyclohydrolase [Candidatus Neomarinimicrobiota bacterium]|tara:strand:- start:861 stop:1742 length:882 start_codon:yes stop_codon:yes gene_type:complete
MVNILSGKDVSRKVYTDLTPRINSLKEKGITPCLAVILVGEDSASKIYVNSKTKKFKSLGLHSKTFHFKNSIDETILIRKIQALNNANNIHGILLQLPLPKHINDLKILQLVSPNKDVDGFHPENVGLLSIGHPRFISCTPKGIMRIFEHYNINLNGKHVVILGRSNIVGRPMSLLTGLKKIGANATTTVCHSGTINIQDYTSSADIVISAMGIPEFLKGKMLKKGAVVIDVGINRVKVDNERGYVLVGDADWHSIQENISAATPVPGGVGPMTIAMLAENTVEAAERIINVP